MSFKKEKISTNVTRFIYEDKKEWLNGRDGHIGGSDAAAILGLNPYKTNTKLWEEKVGRHFPIDISDKEYVKYGIEAEEPLRNLFQLDFPEYQVVYYGDNLIINDKYPFLHASLDGELIDQDGRHGILEIKTTNILQNIQREKWNCQIPDNYYIQVLHYLLVTEYEFVVLKAQLKSVWEGNMNLSTRHYFIERTEVLEDLQRLLKAEQKFWKQVINKTKPDLILPGL